MVLLLFLLLSAPHPTQFNNIRVNSDSVNDHHNEEQIVVNPKDPSNLVACWRDFRLGYRQVAVGYSFDRGLTWEDYLVEGSPFQWDSDPGLTTDTDGNVYLVVLSFEGIGDSNALVVFKSSNGGRSFGAPTNVVLSGPTSFEDKELIACDRTTSEHRGNLYVVWRRLGFGSLIHCSTSKDGGKSWSMPVSINDETGGTQWPVPCVGKDGTLYTAWTRTSAPYGIRFDRSNDAGINWGTDITVVNTSVPSPVEVDGYITTFSFPAMDADITNGPYGGNLYIAYMDQGVNESLDIFFVRSSDGGDTWSTPVRISGEDVPGNDQFHPWLTVDNTGIIHVVFYDQRNGVAEGLLDLYYTYSADGGETWSDQIRVSDVSSKPNLTAQTFIRAMPMPAGLIGEYVGLAAWNGVPFPIWTDCREDGIQSIYFGYHITDAIVEKQVADAGHVLNASFVSEGLRIHFAPAEIGTYHFALYDASGRALGSISQSSSDFVWKVGFLPKGVYFIQVRGQGSEQVVKAIKLR